MLAGIIQGEFGQVPLEALFLILNQPVIPDHLAGALITSTEVAAQHDGIEHFTLVAGADCRSSVLRQQSSCGLKVLARVKSIGDAHSHAGKVKRAYAAEPEIYTLPLGDERGGSLCRLTHIAWGSARRVIAVDADRQGRHSAF